MAQLHYLLFLSPNRPMGLWTLLMRHLQASTRSTCTTPLPTTQPVVGILATVFQPLKHRSTCFAIGRGSTLQHVPLSSLTTTWGIQLATCGMARVYVFMFFLNSYLVLQHPSSFRDMGGALYTGGRAWYEGANTLVYSSERTSRTSKQYSGSVLTQLGDPVPLIVTNFKAYLTYNAISHWGDMIEINNIEVCSIHMSTSK